MGIGKNKRKQIKPGDERTWTFIYGRKPPTEKDWMRYIGFILEGKFHK